MNEDEIIKAWRQIYAILRATGYDKLYMDEITIVANFIGKHLERFNK